MTEGNGSSRASENICIGVLALQGAFREHMRMLEAIGVEPREIRRAEELEGCSGLIIPGGESTAIALVAERWGLVEPLRRWVRDGKPTFGTCAGMILLAERAEGQKRGGQSLIGGLDVLVNRNYFGRQVHSFEARLQADVLGEEPIPAIFIRAPAVTDWADDVEILATIPGAEGEPVAVAVRHDAILATAFHPELSQDLRWHRLFLDMVK